MLSHSFHLNLESTILFVSWNSAILRHLKITCSLLVPLLICFFDGTFAILLNLSLAEKETETRLSLPCVCIISGLFYLDARMNFASAEKDTFPCRHADNIFSWFFSILSNHVRVLLSVYKIVSVQLMFSNKLRIDI